MRRGLERNLLAMSKDCKRVITGETLMESPEQMIVAVERVYPGPFPLSICAATGMGAQWDIHPSTHSIVCSSSTHPFNVHLST